MKYKKLFRKRQASHINCTQQVYDAIFFCMKGLRKKKQGEKEQNREAIVYNLVLQQELLHAIILWTADPSH
jgi:hypothetical protein